MVIGEQNSDKMYGVGFRQLVGQLAVDAVYKFYICRFDITLCEINEHLHGHAACVQNCAISAWFCCFVRLCH